MIALTVAVGILALLNGILIGVFAFYFVSAESFRRFGLTVVKVEDLDEVRGWVEEIYSDLQPPKHEERY